MSVALDVHGRCQLMKEIAQYSNNNQSDCTLRPQQALAKAYILCSFLSLDLTTDSSP